MALSRREQTQSSEPGILTSSNSGSVAGGTRFSASDDAEREDELYRRYIAPWRQELNATDLPSSHDDGILLYERSPAEISDVPRVSQVRRDVTIVLFLKSLNATSFACTDAVEHMSY